MDILYNGIHLTMCDLSEYSMDAAYDPTGTDLLYHRHRIVGVFAVNGQADVREVAGPPVSYVKTGELVGSGQNQIDGAPSGVSRVGAVVPRNVNVPIEKVFHDPSGAGVFGDAPPSGLSARSPNAIRHFKLVPAANPVPLTMQAIRFALLQPRKQLFVFAEDGADTALLLRSPRDFSFHCDAANGPKPLVCEILNSQGEASTFLVQFGIETYVNESDLNSASSDSAAGGVGSPLLSNRFSMTHFVDEQHLTSIEVNGEAHFRSDFLYSTATSPDDLRQRLFLPCPFGFVRDAIVVEGFRDGTGVRYKFADRQLPVHTPGAAMWGASKISAVHTQAIVSDADLLKGTAAVLNDLTAQTLNAKWLKEANERSKEPTPPAAPATAPAPVPHPRTPPVRALPARSSASTPTLRPSRVTVPRSPRLR